MSTTVSTVTTVIETKDLGDGKYEVKEIKSDEISPPDLHSGNIKEFHADLVYGLGVGEHRFSVM